MQKFTNFAMLFALIVIVLTACSQPLATASGIEFSMNTFVEINFWGENSQLAYDETVAMLNSTEDLLSLHREDSEISKINANAGIAPVKVSDETFSLIKTSIAVADFTDGLFDITIAPLTLLWSVTDENPVVPSNDDITIAMSLVNYKDIQLNEAEQTVFLKNPAMKMDLGGIVKGQVAEKTRVIAQKHNVQGFVSVGGNMMVYGKKTNNQEYKIGVRDPAGEASDYIGTVEMDGLTMSTTGGYERFFIKDGISYHHIIDPFSGFPSDSDLLSVTVLSENGMLADALSTAIFMGGTAKLDNFLNQEDFQIIAVTNQNKVYLSDSLEGHFSLNTTEYTLI